MALRGARVGVLYWSSPGTHPALETGDSAARRRNGRARGARRAAHAGKVHEWGFSFARTTFFFADLRLFFESPFSNSISRFNVDRLDNT